MRRSSDPEPAPFAPGGDDVLSWDDYNAQRARGESILVDKLFNVMEAGAQPRQSVAVGALGHAAAAPVHTAGRPQHALADAQNNADDATAKQVGSPSSTLGRTSVSTSVSTSASTSASTLRSSTGAHPPSVRLALGHQASAQGLRAVLHISTQGAQECHGLGALRGLLPLSGPWPLPQMLPGRHPLTVACWGPGGRSEAALVHAVPLPVPADAQNPPRHDVDGSALPTGFSGVRAATATGLEISLSADFFQEGRYSIMNLAPQADGSVQVVFWGRDDNGAWADRSAALLPQASERRACAAAQQALVADFNHDGKPDILLVCGLAQRVANSAVSAHANTNTNTNNNTNANANSTAQLLWLSQPDGRYRRAELTLALPVRQARTLDADADGHVDILAQLAQSADAGGDRALLLRGRGDGSFSVP